MTSWSPVVVTVAVAVASVAFAVAPASAVVPTARYEPPVDGPVVRGFDPPATHYGDGHRGVDLGAAPHATVRAAATGTVAFAGSVGGHRWVSIAHPDGVTTTYGPLDGVRVAERDPVDRGSPIGRLAPGGHGRDDRDVGLHWGAKIGGRYIDPLGLLDASRPRPSLVGEGDWRGTDHAVVSYEPWSGGRAGGMTLAPSPVAERPGFAVAPNPNHLVLVPGLASDAATPQLDAGHLGVTPESVTRFSYAGRLDVPGPPDDPARDQRPHGPSDTWDGVEPAVELLAAQLRAQAAREPGRPVDLVGHSMGGVVILRYLVEHHDPFDPTLPQIGHVVTIAAPLDGSDLASIGRSVREAPLVGRIVRALQDRGRLGGDRLPLDAPAIDELAVGSASLWKLATGWDAALSAGLAGPLATGTRVLNVGGARDLVVSAARTSQPDTFEHHGAPRGLERDPETGAPHPLPAGSGGPAGPREELDGRTVVDHRVLPGGHVGVLHTEAMREVVWRFLAGEDPVASPGHLSRVVGGELADGARLGAELSGVHGPVMRVFRHGRQAMPLAPRSERDDG